jgi:iron-sulfur cluster repair protein YtfE (RIC family)
MHALELLAADHRRVERLLNELEGTTTRGVRTRNELIERLERELVAHETIEEEIFYPALRDHPKAAELVLEAYVEHDVVDRLLSELRSTPVDADAWGPTMKVLAENLRHHVEEEEKELFPMVAKALGKERLKELGEAMAEAKKAVPTRPHPRMPDEPPGNLLGAPGAALVDKALDAGRKLVRDNGRKVRQAVGATRSR